MTDELRLLAVMAHPDDESLGIGGALARYAAVVLETPLDGEACPLDLAPTSSTTAAMAVGDALAVALCHGHHLQTRRRWDGQRVVA